MEVFITFEWHHETEVSVDSILKLSEQIELFFVGKDYGTSIKEIWIVINSLGFDAKPRKKYRKDFKRFEFYLYLDLFLIKNTGKAERKPLILKELIEKTEITFANSKFQDFNVTLFLTDWQKVVSNAAF